MEKRSTLTTWSILIVNTLLVILSQFDKNAISVAAVPISKEFGFSTTQMGLIISCFFTSYTIMNVIGGYISDALGSRKVIIATCLGFSAFTGITGLAWSFTSLLIIRFIFGAAEGAFPPTNGLIVSELFSVEKRATAKSFITAASALGAGLGAIAITQITQSLGWRKAFSIYCVVGFVLTIIFFLISGSLKVNRDKTKDQKKTKMSYTAIFKEPIMWRVLPIQFAFGVFQWGLNSWMPSYWMNVKGLKLVAMGFASAIPQVATAIMVLSMGVVLDKYMMGREKNAMAFGAIVAAIGVYLTFTAPTVILGVTFNTIASLGAGLLTQANVACVIKYCAKGSIGTGAGLANAASQLAGIVTPAIMGYIISASGGSYAAVFGFVIGMLAIAFIIALTQNTKEAAEKALAERAATSA